MVWLEPNKKRRRRWTIRGEINQRTYGSRHRIWLGQVSHYFECILCFFSLRLFSNIFLLRPVEDSGDAASRRVAVFSMGARYRCGRASPWFDFQPFPSHLASLTRIAPGRSSETTVLEVSALGLVQARLHSRPTHLNS